MKHSYRFLSIMVVLLPVALAGCDKNFLSRTPKDSVPTSSAFTSTADFQAALNGAYAGMRSVSIYGRDFPVIGDLMADNTWLEQAKNSGRYLPQWQYTVVVNDAVVSEIWPACYADILRTNNIIDNTISNLSTADQATLDQIKAQAYAIRAILYFKLVNFYAAQYTVDSGALGVPLILHYDPTLYPARSTVGEIYHQVVTDLKAGMANAPAYSNSITLSKYAIEGLLARVYLYMGDNPDAEASAADVINNGGFSLVSIPNFQTFWANPAVQTDATEVMFEVDCDVLNNNAFDDLGGIYVNGYDDLYCSSQLYNLYDSTDVRKTLIVPGNTDGGVPALIVNKFQNAQNADRDNLKVIRLAEVYLVAAEAALPGDETTAKKYLNALVAMRDTDPTRQYTSTGAQLLADIVNERRKELAFEGDRLFDLDRLHMDVNRGVDNGELPAGPNNVNLYIPFKDFRRLAPIPQSETQINENIAPQQNPGY